MNLKKIIGIALISVLAYILMLFIKIPVSFLDFDIKDIIVALGGVILGVIPCLIISFLVAFLELITVSSTGIVGFLMNFISTIFYVVPIVLIYKRKKSRKYLVFGILLGTISMTLIMVLFNILITPIYLGVPLKEVLKLLLTLIIPFNIGKGILNGILYILISNPLEKALKKAKFF